MSIDNLFLKASREQLRFETNARGDVTTEDLWSFDLRTLDAVAVSVNSRLKADSETFLKSSDPKKAKTRSGDELRLEILKVIIETKQTEADEKKADTAKKANLSFLRELAEKKKMDSKANMTLEQIEAEIAKLSA